MNIDNIKEYIKDNPLKAIAMLLAAAGITATLTIDMSENSGIQGNNNTSITSGRDTVIGQPDAQGINE